MRAALGPRPPPASAPPPPKPNASGISFLTHLGRAHVGRRQSWASGACTNSWASRYYLTGPGEHFQNAEPFQNAVLFSSEPFRKIPSLPWLKLFLFSSAMKWARSGRLRVPRTGSRQGGKEEGLARGARLAPIDDHFKVHDEDHAGDSEPGRGGLGEEEKQREPVRGVEEGRAAEVRAARSRSGRRPRAESSAHAARVQAKAVPPGVIADERGLSGRRRAPTASRSSTTG